MCILGYLLNPVTKYLTCCPWLPFMPYEPTLKNEWQTMANNRWFEEVAKMNPNCRLRDLVIPATHDVGTYGISESEFFYFAAVTQRVNLYQQLHAGSRSLDLRYGPCGKGREDVCVWHGPFFGPKYPDCFQQIANFVNDNPNEFLIILLSEEHPISDDQKAYLIELIQKYLTPKAVTKVDLPWFNLDTVTVSQVVQNKKNFLILVDDHFYCLANNMTRRDNTDYEALGIFSRDGKYYSPWANVNDPQKMFDYEIDKIEQAKYLKETFLCTQTMLTLQTSDKDIEDYIIGSESLRLDHFTKALHKDRCMSRFFGKYLNHEPFNFVELDFIDYNPDLVKCFIGQNYPHKITIVSATLDGVDVTQKANSLILRERVFYMPNVMKDMGLSKNPKSFTIEFMYDGDISTTSRTYNQQDLKYEIVVTYTYVTMSRQGRQ